MYCNNCGFQNNPGDMVCKQCGTPLNNNQPNQFNQPDQNMNMNMNNNMNMDMNMNNNNMNMNSNGTYKLTLNRPKNFVGSLVKFKIYIDNNEVGTIKNGETVVLDVAAGNHTISFNKTMTQNITITSNTSADVTVMGGNQFGLSNIRDSSGTSIQSNEMNNDSANRIITSAKGPLIFSCACILITFVLLFTVKMVVSPIVYGFSIGYSCISLHSIHKNKQLINDKYNSLLILNVIAIVVSIIGIAISGYLMIG